MPVKVTWYDADKTIISVNFCGDWTWEDYSNTAAEILELTQDIHYRIDQVIDMRASGPVPQGPALMFMNRSYKIAKFKQQGITVLVGAGTILHALVTALAMTDRKRPPRLFADTIEEALRLIEEDRAKKNDAASNGVERL